MKLKYLFSFIIVTIVTLLSPLHILVASASNEQNGIKEIDEDWDFYWHQLWTPHDFRNGNVTTTPSPIHVSSSWDKQPHNNKSFPKYGYGTYHATLHFSKDDIGQTQALFIEFIGSANKIWIDGKLAGTAGVVAKHAKQEVPFIRLQTYSFTPESAQVDLVIQVSNYSYRGSGIYGQVAIGQADELTWYVFKNFLLENLLISGTILAVALYSLIVYINHRSEHSALWLGLLALTAAVRNISLNNLLIPALFPSIDIELAMKLRYSIPFLVLSCFIMLNRSFYPHDVQRRVSRVFLAILALCVLYIWMSSMSEFTSTLLWQCAVMGSILLYHQTHLAIVTLYRKRPGVYLNIVGMIFIFIAFVNDTLFYLQVIESIPLIPYSFIIYLLLQAIIVAHRFAKLLTKNVAIAAELKEVNVRLEEMVQERTIELQKKNEQLTTLMANIAHDLGSPMAAIHSHLQVIQQNAEPNSKKQHIHARMNAKMSLMRRMVQDLLMLSKLDANQLKFDYTYISPASFWSHIQEQLMANEMTQTQHMTVAYETTLTSAQMEHYSVKVDLYQMKRVIQNLIDNAIRFRKDSSCRLLVQMNLRRTELDLKLEVAMIDDGRGIPEDELRFVFERFFKNKTHSDGSGLGLAIVKDIVEQHGGTVEVTSEFGVSSTFSFLLPVITPETFESLE